MSKLRSLIGYTLAILTIPIVMATFVGLDGWSRFFVATTGLQISPWLTGGEEDRSVDRGGYHLVIRHPVFQGLLMESKEGFIQMEWTPLENVPGRLREQIDWDKDGRPDFDIFLDTIHGKAKLIKNDPRVLGIGQILKLQNAWAVRVNLRNR